MTKNPLKVIFFYTDGIGNQLFQIAGISYFYGKNEEIINRSDLLFKNPLKFFLRLTFDWKYNCPDMILVKKYPKVKDSIFSYIALIILFIKFKLKKNKEYVSKSYSEFRINNEIYYFGYFQDRLYLNDEKSRQLIFSVFPELRSLGSKPDNVLAIHIREGDFKDYPEDNILSEEYYKKSLTLIRKEDNIKIEKIIILGIFSDNFINLIRSICRNIFPNTDLLISKGKEIDDFGLLWKSKYIVSSNSTFCFWASLYGFSKTIVFPYQFNKYNIKTNKNIIFNKAF